MKLKRFFLAASVLAAFSIQADVFAQATSVKRITRGLPTDPEAPVTTAKPPAPPPRPVTVVRTNSITNGFYAPAALPTEKEKAETLRKTIEFQRQRAEGGSDVSQYDLGMRYLKGDGVLKDISTARKWLERAAAAGNNQAKAKLKEIETQK